MQKQKELVKKYGIKPNKRLGQNFLLDTKPVKQMLEAAEITKDDVVVEVGPGLGAITLVLAEKAKQVIAIERDAILANALKKILQQNNIENIEVKNEDALKAETPKQNYKLVGNLPYNSAVAIIMKFLQAKPQPRTMAVMLQKEVAQRITAKPPKMNKLAIFCALYADVKIIDYVKKDRFFPKPKVDSAILLLLPKQPPADLDVPLFEKLVNAGFATPRKTLANNLRRPTSGRCPMSGVGTLLAWLEKNSIQPSQRPQELSLNDWLNLTKGFPQPLPPAK